MVLIESWVEERTWSVIAMPTILIVDDDPLLIAVISHKMRFHGFDVVAVENGVDALREARDKRPNVIILDAMMPGRDGFSVLRELKSAPETAGIPVLMLTAKKTERDVVAGLSLGAADYVTKPFSPAELYTRVTRLLDGAKSVAPVTP